MRLPLSVILLTATLAACSQGDEAPDIAGSDDAPSAATAEGTTGEDEAAPPADESPEVADDADSPEPAVATEAATDNGFSSAYTQLDLENCRVIAQNREEGGWVQLRCAGYKGIPLFVSEGDLRFDVDAGVSNDRFQTILPFNTVGETIEWRMKDGKPFAVIFRYRDVSQETGPRSVLVVDRIGRQGAPGCRVAEIAGKTPRANERARRIADRDAATFDCAKEPRTIGRAQ